LKIKELFVLALATIAGVLSAYSDELFRAIITVGIFFALRRDAKGVTDIE
jgi:hypothetical protein